MTLQAKIRKMCLGTLNPAPIISFSEDRRFVFPDNSL